MEKKYFLPHGKLQVLLDIIKQDYRCIGPQVRDDTIVYDELDSIEQLPWGYVDGQLPGKYKLEQSKKTGYFNWVNGPQAVKPYLFKPKESLWQVYRDDEGKLSFKPSLVDEKTLCFFGVRPCDVAAMQIQDNVFINDEYKDQRYIQRRDKNLIIVANCITSSNNCFCVAVGGYPKAENGFDIALTELESGFIVEFGSRHGYLLMKDLNLKTADENLVESAKNKIKFAANKQTKSIPTKNLKDNLMKNLEHPRWDNVAERCLSCGNCTQVCPTCFCHKNKEKASIDGSHSEHVREWDSCFTQGHSYIHGKVIRSETRQRYRQWLTHKFATWHEQFGQSGCVGCWRCVSWCPAGIDVTEELNAICGENNEDKG